MKDDEKIDMFLAQKRVAQQFGDLRSTPYHIQALSLKLDRIEYKLNLLLEQKETKC
jgi:hypothetical protein